MTQNMIVDFSNYAVRSHS